MLSRSPDGNIAFIFPGQGSQVVGMGKELHDHSVSAKRVFQEADDTLGFSLTRMCFDGPQDELTQTQNAQPAIFTTSIAALADMSEKLGCQNITPSFVAGHSLGEYTALVAAKAVKFSEALKLVQERGRLMQNANSAHPGGMAAIIGLNELIVKEICEQTDLEISNINSREQIVISGSKENIPNALDLAKTRGAKKVVPLPVGSAFHSTLMEPTIGGMTKALALVNLSDAKVPIVANSTAKPILAAAEIREELLRQLCHCVHWLKSVEYMFKAGVSTFVEIGPGKVLSSLVRRIEPSATAVTITDFLNGR